MIDVKDLIGKSFEEYDCRQVCLEVMRRSGNELFTHDSSSSDIWDIRDAIQKAMDDGCFRKLEHPVPGCIVAIKMVPPFVDHMGIMLDKYTFIHATEQYGVVVNRIDDGRWKRRVAGFYLYDPGFNGCINSESV